MNGKGVKAMFVYSVKATTIRFLSVLVLSGVLLTGVTLYASSAAEASSGAVSETVSYENVKSESERRAFLSSLGFTVTKDAESTVDFTLPKALDAVLLGYNEIQKEQGLDLGKYTGKKVTRYTYEIPDYEGYDGKVYANIIVYRGRVVAADLTGVGEEGFVRPLSVLNEEK